MITIKRLSATVFGIAVLAAAMVAAPSPAAAGPLGLFRVKVADSNQCLAVDSVTFTAFVQPCSTTSASQKWQFLAVAHPDAPRTFNQIRNLSDGRCLDVGDRGGRLTGRIATMPCNTSANQAWGFPDPGTSAMACNWKAYLCDWRPAFTDAPLGGGWIIAFQPPGLFVFWITWRLESVSA